MSAATGPIASLIAPIASTPAGPVPIDVVTRPSTRERASGATCTIASAACMLPNADTPSPPIARRIQARAKEGRFAAAASSAMNRTDPARNMVAGATVTRRVAMNQAPTRAPNGSAPASRPIMAGEASNAISPQAGRTVG